ncbi:MAG TPA: DUF885 domain-containing protein [Burkholderiaceae bacterium]|jgi:uncharacterized protein (DUF885 family)
MKKLLLLAALTLGAAHAAELSPSARLNQLFQQTWNQDLAGNPLRATGAGDTRYNALLPDLSPAAIQARQQANHATLDALRAIDAKTLSPDDKLNYELFKGEIEDRIAAEPFKFYLDVVGLRGGPQTASEWSEDMPFNTVADYENWLSRLRALPHFIEQNEALMRTAMAEHRTPPRILMTRVQSQLRQQLVDSAELSPFYKHFKPGQYPTSIPAADQARLTAQAQSLIAGQVVPAMRRFEKFFSNEYMPACRETVGAWDLPDGAALYANRARHHTTTTLTPEQIHEIGLKEVARIEGEMDALMAQLGYAGRREEFFKMMRTDPKFFYSNPQDLFAAYVLKAKQIEPELPKLFGKLPRTPFGVRPVPDIIAPHTYTAYYSEPAIDGSRAGYYTVNLYRPEVRPKWEIEVLTSHESVPGHHLQIALAQELGELPMFRRSAGYTAFVEGWALYAERLGYEIGLYQDPYSHFGQLSYDMWRAVRLVVDTGIHLKHWTRQQAIDYFMAKAPKAEADIINEVDRYISWPGQALGYKIGQMKILELRARAEKALGPRFNLRAFHDMLLSAGALPLDVLEARVDAWIANNKM